MSVTFYTGMAAAVVGTLMLLSSATNPDSGERVNALAWVVCAFGCFATFVLTRISLIRLSEVMLILTAYFCTASIIITGAPLPSITIGIAAYALVVLLPGIAFRVRTYRSSVFNTAAVSILYILSMLLRAFLHDESGIDSWSDVFIKILVPPSSFWVELLMVRALNRRILDALWESERSRDALRHALDRQVTMNDALLRFVPREFLTSLGRQELSEVQLSDSVTKTMSILFADILGYTKLVEGMTPEATVHLLNDLFGALEPSIHEHHGFVDSYIGDAIMALFDGSPRNAIDAALAMQAALRRHNECRRAAGKPPLAIGIGINTGVVTLGTVGGPKRFKCSVFGDSVNLAARIEHLTRRYDAPLLVSEHTLELVGEGHGYDVRVVDRVRVVGRTSTTTLFEIYDADPEPLRRSKRRIDADFRTGIAAFYDRRFAEALAAFERCRVIHDDGVLRSYAQRSRALLATAPGDAWTGIEALYEK